MNNLWPMLSRREQVVAATGVALLLAILAYLLIVRPVGERLAYYSKTIPSQRELLVWMEQASSEVKHLHSARPKPNEAGGESMLSVINKSAKELKLEGSIKRVEPTEEKGVRVSLDGVGFDAMLPWLALLEEREGLQVNEITVERAKGQGLVNAVVTVNGGRK